MKFFGVGGLLASLAIGRSHQHSRIPAASTMPAGGAWNISAARDHVLTFGVRRGPGQDPADRAPKRGAVTGLDPDGKQVVHVPGQGVHAPSSSPPAIPTPAPNLPDIEIGGDDGDALDPELDDV